MSTDLFRFSSRRPLPPPLSTLFPYTTLFRSTLPYRSEAKHAHHWHVEIMPRLTQVAGFEWGSGFKACDLGQARHNLDRKSTRLNSSHRCISYAVFCLKKKKIIERHTLKLCAT